MIRSLIALCANGVVRDAETNNISIFNLIERISAASFPFFIPHIAFFNLLEKDAGDESILNAIVRVKNNDQIIFSFPVRADFQTSERNRCTVNLEGLTVSSAGQLIFELLVADNLIGSYEIKIEALPARAS